MIVGGPGPHRGFLLPYTPGVQDDTLSVTCKLLSDSYLGVFRVAKIPTLKMPKVVIISDLRVAPGVQHL